MDRNNKRVIVAFDNMTLAEAVIMAKLVKNEVAGGKVGFELLCDEGAENIMFALNSSGLRVFMDPKIHDIPNTAAQTAKKLARRGVWIINLHCSGGRKMMEAVRASVDDVWQNEREKLGLTRKPLVIGVTVLTSIDFKTLFEIGAISIGEYGTIKEEAKPEKIRAMALKLACLAQECGLDGVVTSPQEASAIRAKCGDNFQIITPGIRLPDGKVDDQVRISTPAGAIEAGADWLVIGRPVTQSKDPKATLQLINQQVAEALAKKEGAIV